MKCTECNGTGKITLLISVTPCKACGGTGQATGQTDVALKRLAGYAIWPTTHTADAYTDGWGGLQGDPKTQRPNEDT